MISAFYTILNHIGYTHPVHPTMTYLPIGLIMAALIFALVARITDSPQTAITARHCISLALIAVIPTIATGYMDWQHFYNGRWLHPIQMKIILVSTLVVLLIITLMLIRRLGSESIFIILMYLSCFITVVGIGYFGGNLVFGTQTTHFGATGAEDHRKEPSRLTYNDVEAIFHTHCIMCHSGPNAPKNLRLNSYENIMAGSVDGPVVVPGKPDQGSLLKHIKGISQPRMPFGQPPLPQDQIAEIERWISAGAPQDSSKSVNQP